MRELSSTYRDLNWRHFRQALKPAAIELSDRTSRLGQYDPTTRVLSISRRLVLSRAWPVVVEVLKHEMAHQYVHEVLDIHDESPHGEAFRRVCRERGIDAAATGEPRTSDEVATDEETKVLERVARLLALAESPNVHEAQSAMNAAQRLMLKHNLGSRAHSAAAPRYDYRHLGEPTGRVTEAERLVSTILTKHFFVEAIWVTAFRLQDGVRGSVLEVCGSHANLEMATYVHGFLHQTAERLWVQHRRARRIGGNRDRRTYLAGVMLGFLEKLDAQQQTSRSEGLVWAGDADLHGFYRSRHPRIASISVGGRRRNEAHASGREAGRNLVLHRPMESGPSGGGGGPKRLRSG
ncbi:MAG: DUF2786 domain-containing protein [Deltaproteobacteria bacterium]|nr:DUF2786 domain-containing protein [Deltaproteobacteria bacterium]